MSVIEIQPLTVAGLRPFGWLLGQGVRPDSLFPAFSNADTDFWHEHIFDPGSGGETEVLGVNYRNRQRRVSTLEAHTLTQQAIMPLTGEIIQVVAASQQDGSPDPGTITAFRVPVGEGICMRAGCWHTTRVAAAEVKCLLLTRRSSTIDLVAHLAGGSPLFESAIAVVESTFLATEDAE